MYNGGAMCKVFGSGLAYPTKTNDGRIVPEAGRQNPRADSFSLYLNYVGTKVLDSLLPKSKLSSKVAYVYTDKALKKRRKDEEEKIKSKMVNIALVQESKKQRVKGFKNQKKLIKKTEITKKDGPAKQLAMNNEPKTPIKKPYPTKMREKVNS
jgi:hypothetical protein